MGRTKKHTIHLKRETATLNGSAISQNIRLKGAAPTLVDHNQMSWLDFDLNSLHTGSGMAREETMIETRIFTK